MPKIGNKVINYSVYAKVNEKIKPIGDTTSITLPSVEFAADKISGAGIMGEIDWPSLTSVNSMSFSPGFRIDNEDAIQLSAPKAQEFEVRWVTEMFDSTNIKVGVDAHKVIIKAVPKKYEPGKVEAGAAMDGSNEYEVLYYKKVLNGKVVLEIDKLNYKFVVDGVDYAAQIRSAL